MAKIRATCAECGDVELTVDDVVVRVCITTDDAEFRFRCPFCRIITVKQTDTVAVELLVSSGVELTIWSFPDEMFELKTGSPISYDDLIDFHRLLHDDDLLRGMLDELAA